jgi:hypothetical protein
MRHNLDSFLKTHPELSKKNVLVTILRTLCKDAADGKKTNPQGYLAGYKALINKICAIVFLSGFIPFLVFIFMGIDAIDLLNVQVLALLCVLIMRTILCSRFDTFTSVFYSCWYDKILNFDLISVQVLRPLVLEALQSPERDRLAAAVNAFSEAEQQRSEALLRNSNQIAEKIDAFIALQQAGNGITAQNVSAAFLETLEKVESLGAALNEVNNKMASSLDHLTLLSDRSKIDINALNRNAALLSDLRRLFVTYKSDAVSAEILHLQAVTKSLEEEVVKTFESIEAAISKNIESLQSGYGSFFDMCNKFNDAVSNTYDAKTANVLAAINERIAEGFRAVREETAGLAAAVEKTSESTQILCQNVHDFTQFTLSPSFMHRIKDYATFYKKLNFAASHLISYEKLRGLYKEQDDEAADAEQKEGGEST